MAGPHRDGSISGRAWPARLTKGALAPLWRVDGLGKSYATPIVTPETVFTVGTEDETGEVVRALDRETGAILWESRLAGAMQVPFFAARERFVDPCHAGLRW